MRELHLLELLAWLYAGLFVGYLLWTHSSLRRPWWLKALSPVSFWVFLPTLALPLCEILARSPSFLLPAVLSASLFCYHYLLPMLPKRAPIPKGPHIRLTVMTANLYKHNASCSEIVETILAESPDMVALQELKQRHIASIENRLKRIYPYQALYPGVDSEGMGFLSRYPFLSVDSYQGPPDANPTQVISIEIAGKRIWCVNIHSRIPRLQTWSLAGIPIPKGMDTTGRQSDIERIIKIVEDLQGDAIVLGDMNTTSECPEYRLIPPQWINAYARVGKGLGFTYPIGQPFFGLRTPLPLFRIDHLFYRGRLCAIEARTGAMPGSDHRYLLVRLAAPCK